MTSPAALTGAGVCSRLSNRHSGCSRERMTENPFAEYSVERAIGLRWTLRDIQARRLMLSPISDEDMQTLTELGLVELRDEGPVLTPAGKSAANGD